MKIGILTHYNVASHGAYLQLYAMHKTLEGLGHEPYVLTYVKNYDFATGDEARKFQVGFKSVSFYLKRYLIDTGFANCAFQAKKQRELRSFGSRTFSYRPYALEGLDAAVIGADEVLSLQYGVNYMMYGHGVGARNTFAYAPSFGQTDMERIERFHVRELMTSGLASMQGVSARDEETAKLIERLCGREPRIVCDPALLYGFERERASFGECPIEKPYLLVYAYTTNMNEPALIQAVQDYAKRRNLITVSLEGYHSWCDRNVSSDPVRMLSWFANAAAVVTDTFHGTISSVIAHAPLALFTRPTNTVKLGYLVRQLGLADRVATLGSSLEATLSIEQDFEVVDETVSALRREGMAYLEEQQALSEV